MFRSLRGSYKDVAEDRREKDITFVECFLSVKAYRRNFSPGEQKLGKTRNSWPLKTFLFADLAVFFCSLI